MNRMKKRRPERKRPDEIHIQFLGNDRQRSGQIALRSKGIKFRVDGPYNLCVLTEETEAAAHKILNEAGIKFLPSLNKVELIS